MGSWGTGLYSNDISCDVRDMCNELYPLLSIEDATRLIVNEYDEIANGEMNNAYADFWLALADWQWKHGILSEEIQQRATTLIREKAGLDEWQENSTPSNVKKRLAVMNAVLSKLQSPQPAVRIPKPSVAKAKHKPGDIVILHTYRKPEDITDSVWRIEHYTDPSIYKPPVGKLLADQPCSPYEAFDQYIALLCVGTEKTPYSSNMSTTYLMNTASIHFMIIAVVKSQQ